MKQYEKTIARIEEFFKNIDAEYGNSEWAVANLIDEYINTLSHADAFRLINDMVRLYLKEKIEIYEILEFILAAARHSDTAEIPNELLVNWEVIREKSINASGVYPLWEQISKFYRILETR